MVATGRPSQSIGSPHLLQGFLTMSTVSTATPLEISVLDQIYAWEAYLVSPLEDLPIPKYMHDNDLHFQPPGNTIDRWLDLSG
jgi:hypothetical protein